MQSFTVGSRLSKVMCAQMKYMLLRLFVYIYITNAGMYVCLCLHMDKQGTVHKHVSAPIHQWEHTIAHMFLYSQGGLAAYWPSSQL